MFKNFMIVVMMAVMAVLALWGCGGSGRTARPDLGGGTAKPELGAETAGPDLPGYLNTAGIDIRDTWKPTEPIKSYFDFQEGGRSPQIGGFDASRYSILGSNGGITYGQRMSGPTDTIDIDFTGYFDRLPGHVQGALERAGKSWSYRFKDALGPHVSTDEVVTGLGRVPDEHNIPRVVPRDVDGMLIDIDSDFENPEWDYVWGYSSARFRHTQIEGNNFTVRTGWLDIAAIDINRGSDWLALIASHEMGHAIGHVATDLNFGPDADPRYRGDTIARYVDYDRGVWTGPALTAANGGRQVAFQRLDEYGLPSPEGELDFGHLGACEMIMSYCGDVIVIPHEMDFAFMKDIGYTVEDSYPDEPEFYSYGAWADYSAWAVWASRTMTFSPDRITDRIEVDAEVYGTSTEADFASVHTGTLTWSGSLLATDLTSFAPVFGRAEIVLSADTLGGTTQFTHLQTVRDVNGRAQLLGWRKSSLEYGVRVTRDGFKDADEKVVGGFFGPTHEEVAGVLDDGVEKILGAFGGTR